MRDLTRLDDKCLVREVDEKKRTARFHAQTTRLASDRLVILPNAGKKRNKEFMQNPIVVPYHMRFNDQGDPVVIGRVTNTEFTDEGMFQTAEFAETNRATQWWELVRDGFVNMVSIAWNFNDVRETDPGKMLKLLDKHKIRLGEDEKNMLRGVVKEFRQTDLSMVAIGADPGALKRVAEDTGNKVADELVESQRYDMDNYRFDEDAGLYIFSSDGDENIRGVIAFKKYPLAAIGASWDGPAQIRAADIPTLKSISTWFDDKKPDVKGSYKLPHHLANNKKTVWNGVRAAMGALLGARGGIKGVPAGDRRGIYNHLAKHYKEFEKEPPPFREDLYTEEELREMGFDDLVSPPATEPKRIVVKLDVDGVVHSEKVMQAIADEINNQVDEKFKIVCERRPDDKFSEIPGNEITNEAIRDAVNTAIENKLREYGLITNEEPENDLDAPDPVDDTEARGDVTEDDIYGELLDFDPNLARKEADRIDPDVPDELLDFSKSIQTKEQK